MLIIKDKSIGWVVLFTCICIWLSNPRATFGQAIGRIQFPNSGKMQAQEPFLQGVLLLHSFEYQDAVEAFRAAQKQDPDFALAYWGEAMAYNPTIWPRPPLREQALATLNKLAPTPEGRLAKAPTEREKGFLQAVEALYSGPPEKQKRDEAFHEAMERLYQKYPDDLEVTSFYALAKMGIRQSQQAAMLAQKVLDKHPYHPGALHYLIHAYDNPQQAHLALEAAERYPKAAPYASHALHMPSHIFAALGRWDELVSSNEQSMAAADDRMKRKGLGVKERGYHSIWWLAYGYLQQGRFQEALALLQQVERNASESNDPFIRSNLTWIRAHYLIETQDWDRDWLRRPVNTSDLNIDFQNIARFTNGYAALHRGEINTARQALQTMNASLLQKIPNPTEAHQHNHGTGETNNNLPIKNPFSVVLQKELEGLILLKEGQSAQALKSLRQAAQTQDSMGLQYGQPGPIKPAHELLGEVLLTLKLPAEARKEFELALKQAPGRVLSLEGLSNAAAQSGNQKLAQAIQAEIRVIRRKADASVIPRNKLNR